MMITSYNYMITIPLPNVPTDLVDSDPTNWEAIWLVIQLIKNHNHIIEIHQIAHLIHQLVTVVTHGIPQYPQQWLFLG